MIRSLDKADETWTIDEIKNLSFSKKVALVYPNEYKVACSNLGFHIIFKNLSFIGHKPVRFFFDRLKGDFISYDTEKKLKDFEYIFISISFENDVENLWKYFNKFQLKTNKIIIGGSAVSLSPFLFTDIAEKIAIGDSEQYFADFTRIEDLKFIDSEYVKEFFNGKEIFDEKEIEINKLIDKSKSIFNEKEIIIDKSKSILNEKEINSNLFLGYKRSLNLKLLEFNNKFNKISDTKTPAYSIFISEESAFPNYFLIEISRGCPFNCFFCTMKNLYNKYRLFDLNEILEKLSIGYSKTKNFGLISAFSPPIKYIKEIKKNFPDATLHFSSLRVDSINEEFLEVISTLNLKTLTIAPETAIEEIRFKIGKKFTNSQIFDFIQNASKNKIFKFKFYFILGLKALNPENDENQSELALIDEAKSIIEFIDMAQSLIYEKYKRTPFFSISINPLIPKPLTLLSDYNFMNINLYKKAKEFMKKEIYKRKNLSIDFISYNEAKKEYFYSWNFVENFKLNNNLYL